MQRGDREERTVRQGHHDVPIIRALHVGRQASKVHLDVRCDIDDDGVWEGKKIGNQLKISGRRERRLIDPHIAVEYALKVSHKSVNHHSLLDYQDNAFPPSVVVVGYRSESGRMSVRLGWSNRHRYYSSS